MVVKLVILLLIILGLLLTSHWGLFVSIMRALGPHFEGARKYLLVILICLSLSFPVALILVNTVRNAFSGYVLNMAALWMAVFINLFIASGAAWLFYLLLKHTGVSLSFRWIFCAFGAIALAVSAWGWYRARNPIIHSMEISIKNLPDEWQGKTIVQLSDLHLGYINRPGFMKRIAERVNKLNPELILITGDLFDGPGGNYERFSDAVNKLEARRGVFMVSGNHEIYSRTSGLLAKLELRVLKNEVVEVDGLQIAGVGFPGIETQDRLESFRKKLSEEKPSILLFHTPTDIYHKDKGEVARHFTTYWMPDTSCGLNRSMGIDLQLSGHTHAGQIFPFGHVAALIYKNRHSGLHRDGDFQLYVSDGTGTFGPPMRTAGMSEIVLITLKKSD